MNIQYIKRAQEQAIEIRKKAEVKKSEILAKELRRLICSRSIAQGDPDISAEILISLIEGYRHFKHFYVGSGLLRRAFGRR